MSLPSELQVSLRCWGRSHKNPFLGVWEAPPGCGKCGEHPSVLCLGVSLAQLQGDTVQGTARAGEGWCQQGSSAQPTFSPRHPASRISYSPIFFLPFFFSLSFLITVGFKLAAVLLYRAQRDVFLSSHAPAGGSLGMPGHPGLCSCARSGVAPWVLERLVAVPLGSCMGDEVFRVARAARNTLWELCTLWKARTPLKSIRTCCRTARPAVASGWPRGCRGRRVRGHRGCPMP